MSEASSSSAASVTAPASPTLVPPVPTPNQPDVAPLPNLAAFLKNLSATDLKSNDGVPKDVSLVDEANNKSGMPALMMPLAFTTVPGNPSLIMPINFPAGAAGPNGQVNGNSSLVIPNGQAAAASGKNNTPSLVIPNLGNFDPSKAPNFQFFIPASNASSSSNPASNGAAVDVSKLPLVIPNLPPGATSASAVSATTPSNSSLMQFFSPNSSASSSNPASHSSPTSSSAPSSTSSSASSSASTALSAAQAAQNPAALFSAFLFSAFPFAGMSSSASSSGVSSSTSTSSPSAEVDASDGTKSEPDATASGNTSLVVPNGAAGFPRGVQMPNAPFFSFPGFIPMSAFSGGMTSPVQPSIPIMLSCDPSFPQNTNIQHHSVGSHVTCHLCRRKCRSGYAGLVECSKESCMIKYCLTHLLDSHIITNANVMHWSTVPAEDEIVSRDCAILFDSVPRIVRSRRVVSFGPGPRSATIVSDGLERTALLAHHFSWRKFAPRADWICPKHSPNGCGCDKCTGKYRKKKGRSQADEQNAEDAGSGASDAEEDGSSNFESNKRAKTAVQAAAAAAAAAAVAASIAAEAEAAAKKAAEEHKQSDDNSSSADDSMKDSDK